MSLSLARLENPRNILLILFFDKTIKLQILKIVLSSLVHSFLGLYLKFLRNVKASTKDRLLFCVFFFQGLLLFSNGSADIIQFKNISFEEFKINNNSQLTINTIFKKQKKKPILEGIPLSDLINKFYNTNHLSLKIKRGNEKENELKISFSKSSLAIKYMLD